MSDESRRPKRLHFKSDPTDPWQFRHTSGTYAHLVTATRRHTPMKTRAEVHQAKLRGGFYTPSALVGLVVQRVEALTATHPAPMRILEPTAGDGAFIRGLATSRLGATTSQMTAIELDASEVEICRSVTEHVALNVDVIHGDFLRWRLRNQKTFDVALGNPPFVRFQFLTTEAKQRAAQISSELGLPEYRVSNLWISVLLGALSTLEINGAFAFVVPAECFTGTSARSVRDWLITNCDDLVFDLFPPGAFPDVLQETVVMSGRRCTPGDGSKRISICDLDQSGRQWIHTVDPNAQTWTRYLLPPHELDALKEAQDLSRIRPLGDLAKFDVAAVTGANSFFSVSQDTVDLFDLEPWIRELLPRIRHAKGLVYSTREHEALRASGTVCALLDFGPERPDPLRHSGARRYLESGERLGLHTRFKTRTRDPWYRVPNIRSGQLLMSKRSHWYPRVIANMADIVTTDTIYRGRLLQQNITPQDFASAFHNSLTLLSAEIEGRSFGGGVLEVVPSEVSRLSMPVIPGFGVELERLDRLARIKGADECGSLVSETNAFIVKADIGLSSDLFEYLESARIRLLDRRLARNGTPPFTTDS